MLAQVHKCVLQSASQVVKAAAEREVGSEWNHDVPPNNIRSGALLNDGKYLA